MLNNHLPTIIYGSGGASKEVYGLIKQINLSSCVQKYEVLGFVEKVSESIGRVVCDTLKVVASDNTIDDLIQSHRNINVIIPIAEPSIKMMIYSRLLKHKNIIFPNIIHPSVIYTKEQLDLGCGNILCAGIVIGWELKAGNFNYFNRSCTLGHDLEIGNYNTINPMATISGNVSIGDNNLIGAGSIILQGLTVTDDVILGAGAVLTKNANKGEVLLGIPAKIKQGDFI